MTPPTVTVEANYPGADAKTVADTVASVIETEVNGVEDMLYMSSKCTSDGRMTLTTSATDDQFLSIKNAISVRV